jgi:DNA adenine methylase
MESIREVEPVRPVAPYLGGKRNLAKRLVARINEIPHTAYAEPFVGMGGVFLRRNRAPKVEVINDLNRDIANFFRILQRHYQQFLDVIKWSITTRAEFERLVKIEAETLTDLERAARFLYLQRSAFGGHVSRPTFGVSPDRVGRFDLTKLVPMLEDLHSRLAGVVIECLPYRRFLDRYDRPGTLFYVDPPYWGGENDYGKGMFERADYEILAEGLAGLKGTFILSINDVPEIREIFGGFRLDEVTTNYSVSNRTGQNGPARGLIITP